MTRPVISVENLSKAYRIGLKEEAPDTIVGAAKGMLRSPWKNLRKLQRLNTNRHQGEEDTLWALKDVSFEVHEGDVIGIIGRNGAGKSTLLKILSRITEPTSGRAVIRGRVSSLLEVGTGFHPELTGRDNVYMNGTILGMTKREIDRKFDEIVEFSGVEKFLDTPTKRYSSGMQVRLAFAVAAHLEPEILIVDEVLAVGDFGFQRKCLGKMEDISSTGRTVLFVSHNLAAVGSLCSKAIVLSDGIMRVFEPVENAIERYLESDQMPQALSSTTVKCGDHNQFLLFCEQQIINRDCGEEISLRFTFTSPTPISNPSCGFVIYDLNRVPVAGGSSKFQGVTSGRASKQWNIHCQLGTIPLIPGKYTISLWLGTTESDLARIPHFLDLNIGDKDPYACGFAVPKNWGHFYWEAGWTFA